MPTLVVNLFGGPGSGKSTGAAYVFARLKMLGYNAELVTEFAKDKNLGEKRNRSRRTGLHHSKTALQTTALCWSGRCRYHRFSVASWTGLS